MQELTESRKRVLDIPDEFDYNDNLLIAELSWALRNCTIGKG